MIDWVSMVVPCEHLQPIRSGCFQRVDAAGNVEWRSDMRLSVKGSFDSTVTIRTAAWHGDCTHIEVSGNIVKFFQGHNLWGTDDLHGLAFEFLRWLTLTHGQGDTPLVSPSESDVLAWRAGAIALTRVDCTESFHLGSKAEVLAFLRSAEQTAHLSHRGRGQLVKGSTLYFGKNSRRSSLKLYSKGQEIQAKDHGQESVLLLPSAIEYANRSLRAEFTIRSMELKRLGLDQIANWIPVDGVPLPVTSQLLRGCLGSMTMTTTDSLSQDVLDALRPALRAAVAAWESGHDLRAMFTRATFYRYRAELLPLGIDIATLRPREVSNVVPLFKVLEAVPVGVPDWAQDSALYFEPRRIA